MVLLFKKKTTKKQVLNVLTNRSKLGSLKTEAVKY